MKRLFNPGFRQKGRTAPMCLGLSRPGTRRHGDRNADSTAFFQGARLRRRSGTPAPPQRPFKPFIKSLLSKTLKGGPMYPHRLRRTTIRLRLPVYENLRSLAYGNRMSMSAVVDSILANIPDDVLRRYIRFGS